VGRLLGSRLATGEDCEEEWRWWPAGGEVLNLFLFWPSGELAWHKRGARSDKQQFNYHAVATAVKFYNRPQYHRHRNTKRKNTLTSSDSYNTQLILLQVPFQHEYPLAIARGRKFLWPQVCYRVWQGPSFCENDVHLQTIANLVFRSLSMRHLRTGDESTPRCDAPLRS
jgi:hypothetical protein